jgi:hypothetical protein
MMILVKDVTMIKIEGAKDITVNTNRICKVDDIEVASSSELRVKSIGPSDPVSASALSAVVTVSAAVVAYA